MLTEPFAVRSAERPVGQGEQHLLAHDIFQRKPALFIIPDLGLFFRDGSLAGVTIGGFGAEDEVEVAGEALGDGIEAAGAEEGEVALVAGAEADVFDDFLVAVMLEEEIGLTGDGERPGLEDVGGVLHGSGGQSLGDFEGFLGEIERGNQHGPGVIFSCLAVQGLGGRSQAGRSGEVHANGGDAGGSGGEALRDRDGGDAAEGEDGRGVGGAGGRGEAGEADTGLDELAVYALFEDGAEEDEVGAGVAGGVDVCEGMGADAENGVGTAGFDEGGAGGSEGSGGAGAGEVEAVGVGGEGDSEIGVEEEFGAGARRQDGAEGGGESEEIGRGEIFFAELEEVDVGDGELAGLSDEFMLPETFIARKDSPVCNGVLDHGRQCTFPHCHASGIIRMSDDMSGF